MVDNSEFAYPYQDVFPRPFYDNNGLYISSNHANALMWMTNNIDNVFKNTIIDKLDGSMINLDGHFMIGSDLEQVKHNYEKPTDIKASSKNNKIYFIGDDQHPHCILMVRGWGYLTGEFSLHLPDDEAMKIQDGFLEWVCQTLNERRNDYTNIHLYLTNQDNK